MNRRRKQKITATFLVNYRIKYIVRLLLGLLFCNKRKKTEKE